MNIEVKWMEGLKFQATTEKGLHLTLDGNSTDSPSPTQVLLSSLCACMGIDMLMILTKMRAELVGITVRARAERRKSPPKYFQKVHLEVVISGEVTEKQAERALMLSKNTYCSVLHSLREDLELSWKISLG